MSVSSLSRRQDFCVGLSLCFVPAKRQDLGKPLRLSGPRFRTHELGLADFSTVHSYRTHGSFIKDARGETEAMSPVLSCPSESFFLGTIPSLFWSQALCHIFPCSVVSLSDTCPEPSCHRPGFGVGLPHRPLPSACMSVLISSPKLLSHCLLCELWVCVLFPAGMSAPRRPVIFHQERDTAIVLIGNPPTVPREKHIYFCCCI